MADESVVHILCTDDPTSEREWSGVSCVQSRSMSKQEQLHETSGVQCSIHKEEGSNC